MEENDGQHFYCTKMSPGLDAWRQEKHQSDVMQQYRSCSPENKFKLEPRPIDTLSCKDPTSCFLGGKSQGALSHLYAYHSADSYWNVEGSANEMCTEKKHHIKNEGKLSDYIPDSEPCESQGNSAAEASQPLIFEDRHFISNPSLRENATGLQNPHKLKLEQTSGKLPASSVGGRQSDGLPKEIENAQTFGKIGKIDRRQTSDVEKAINTFKFCLVEFVKDILKPKWKEGKISKDVHKMIVKKTVNKVIESLGASQIQKMQKDIDHYLSLSEQKLSKLVQAYVEKYQKG